MKFSAIVSGLAALSTVTALPTFLSKRATNDTAEVHNKTILLTNDDGWAATNIRAAYRELKAVGYTVILVAPASQRSGYGGKFELPSTVNLTSNAEFGYPAAGAPSWNHEKDDLNVWYFNGTPASSVAFGLNYVIPNYFNNRTVDLVVSGPNEGANLGPGFFTISGTVGAAYTAIGRSIPAIAFSGSNSNNSFFKDDEGKKNDTTFAPNIYAKKIVEIVEKLFESANNHPDLLPLTTGINVNFPAISKSCLDPEWVFSRLSGPSSLSIDLTYNATLGLFGYKYAQYEGAEQNVFGDLTLPSESWLYYDQLCKTSVSVFSIDYDASYQQSKTVEKYLGTLFD